MLKDTLKLFCNIAAALIWMAFCFVAIFIGAPALISAASTPTVISGFLLLGTVVSLNVAIAISLYQYYKTKPNIEKEDIS
jgi:hypothetical protein